MDGRTMQVFGKMPGALPLYQAVEDLVLGHFPGTSVKAAGTQVTFKTKYGYAYAWPPVRRLKGQPAVCLALSFLLDERVESPRFFEVYQPRPGRWIHHLPVAGREDLDDEVLGWLGRAYAFSKR